MWSDLLDGPNHFTQTVSANLTERVLFETGVVAYIAAFYMIVIRAFLGLSHKTVKICTHFARALLFN